MNRQQRILLAIGALLILAMTLFPPWIYVYHREKLVMPPVSFDPTFGQIVKETGQRTGGYHFIFTGPKVPAPAYSEWQGESESPHIDKDRFAVQLIGLILIIVLLVLALRR